MFTEHAKSYARDADPASPPLDGINLEEVPPVRADIDEEPRADDPGDAVRDILGRDNPFARY